MQLITNSQSTKQIALSLNMGVKTVETHRAQLMDRLGIHDIAGLVRYAIKNGLIQLDGDGSTPHELGSPTHRHSDDQIATGD